MNYDYADVLKFWFSEIPSKNWWIKDESFDGMVKDRFLEVHRAAVSGELWGWREFPEGRLAEIIVLDQFSRNMFRDTAEAFGFDPLALILSQEAIGAKADHQLEIVQRAFLYMPFMHSESKIIHNEAVKLFDQPGLESNYEFEIKHKEIIDRFGRYPHRNQILGRTSTNEELEFLKTPGSSF